MASEGSFNSAISTPITINVLNGCKVTEFGTLFAEDLEVTAKGPEDSYTFAAPTETFIGSSEYTNTCGAKSYRIFDNSGTELPAIISLTSRTLYLQTDNLNDVGLVKTVVLEA